MGKLRNVKGRVGRPRDLVPRVPLSLRVTPEVRKRLDQLAGGSGRSISQEAELRLERSFERADLLSDVLTLSYGREVGGLLMAAGTLMTTLGRSATHELRLKNKNLPINWVDDPYGYDQAIRAVFDLLDRARPPGDPISDAMRPEVTENRPPLYASILARALKGTSVEIAQPDWAEGIFGQHTLENIRQLLGTVAHRIRDDGPYNDAMKKGAS